ncbi:tail tape measure protein [Sphingomonas montana]|uniref:tail tape measure protein n=1 Tax=Sphingomonas montana TaxID=1843236 RepID=UPI00096DC079|nr:tail tape measure protein [Sphingomonas montana]
MDDEIERLVIGVRADTAGFARDVAAMRDTLAGPLERDANRAGRAIESALARAVQTGKLGFDDLKRTALAVLGEIAAAAVSGGIASVLGGGSPKRGGLASVAATLVGAVAGLPGRATGGPVSPGAAYVVGEHGPELFVPTSSGQVRAAAGAAPEAGREVRVAISVNVAGGAAPEALARSSRQVARAVRSALAAAER